MVSAKIIVNNEKGLHMRAARAFCEEAMKYNSYIDIKCKNKCLNGKSVLGVLAAGVKNKDEIEIVCTGVDETLALEALILLVENKLGEK